MRGLCAALYTPHAAFGGDVEKTIRLIDTLSTWLGILLSWLIVPLMLITCYDVTARYFFSAPTQWAYDYTIMVYGTLFMLVGAYALAQNNHVRGDVFYRFFPVRVQAALDLVLYSSSSFRGSLPWSGQVTALPRCPGGLPSAR